MPYVLHDSNSYDVKLDNEKIERDDANQRGKKQQQTTSDVPGQVSSRRRYLIAALTRAALASSYHQPSG